MDVYEHLRRGWGYEQPVTDLAARWTLQVTNGLSAWSGTRHASTTQSSRPSHPPTNHVVVATINTKSNSGADTTADRAQVAGLPVRPLQPSLD